MNSQAPVEPLPPPFSTLITERDHYLRPYLTNRPHTWRKSRIPSPFFSRFFFKSQSPIDTSSACFYRIYEFYILDHNVLFRNELEYFCRNHPEWAVSEIPDPQDKDPIRYAILAVLTKLLCDAFNRRIELGLHRDAPAIIQDWDELLARPKVFEKQPEWALQVPPVENRVVIPDCQGRTLEERSQDVCEDLVKMNIIAVLPHLHFI